MHEGNDTAIFRKVMGNTLFYAVTIVPIQLALGLLFAVALNQGIRGLELYRLIYFMPVVTNIVAVAIVFQWLLNRDFGIANAWVWQLAESTGWAIAPPDWLNSTLWAKPAVVLLTVWKNVETASSDSQPPELNRKWSQPRPTASDRLKTLSKARLRS